MCDKVQYTSKRHARLANRRNGKTLRTYVCDGVRILACDEVA
jgi:hypothetical protein